MKTGVIYPSKSAALGLLCGSLAFAAGGGWLIQRGTSVGWVPLLVFGICSLISILALLPGASFLKIEEDGFTLVSFFSASTFRWDEVANFRVEKERVAFDLSPIDARGSVFASSDAVLADTIGFRPEALARMLNECLSKRKETNQSSESTPLKRRDSP